MEDERLPVNHHARVGRRGRQPKFERSRNWVRFGQAWRKAIIDSVIRFFYLSASFWDRTGLTSQLAMFSNPGQTRASQQPPFDAAVVIPTVLRPTLARAVESVYRQQLSGRIQVLAGVDRQLGDPTILDDLRRDCPGHCDFSVFDLGYSTSARNGGIYPGGSGGALRTILSYAANSRAVAYLDDDNWFHHDHIRTLLEALEGHDYAFSLRWYVDPETSRALGVDRWESVGPDAGVFQKKFGGFIDPNTLMIDKLRCDEVLRWWCYPIPNEKRAMSEDRMVFKHLRQNHKGRGTGCPTSYYTIDPNDGMHPHRLRWVAQPVDETL